MEKLYVEKIENGTVIDHIDPGFAPKVLDILSIDENFPNTSAILMFVRSKKYGEKDMVKIEDQMLNNEELNKIALISSNATINIIKDYEVVEKRDVELPEEIKGIIDCNNKNCVTNHEDIEPILQIENKDPLTLRCYYCEKLMSSDDISIS